MQKNTLKYYSRYTIYLILYKQEVSTVIGNSKSKESCYH